MFYLYDGTFEGFLSALTLLMREYKSAADLKCKIWGIRRDGYQTPLVPCETVKNINNISNSFGEYLSSNFGDLILSTVYRAFLSELEGIEEDIALYVFLARKLHKDPQDLLYIDCVKNVVDAAKRTGRESHRFLGLLRFRKILDFKASFDNENNSSALAINHDTEMYYALFDPSTNVLPILTEHFCERLKNQHFIICDTRRHSCSIHIPGKEYQMFYYNPENIKGLEFETSFEVLWKEYFRIMAIPERINKKLQRSNMPLKYRKYLTETTME